MSKTLTIETENAQDLDNVLYQINTIVNKHEPDVIIREKTINKSSKKSLILVGLGCANCAAKIETQIKNLAGVKSATVDFVSKKLVIEVNSKQELNRIIEEATTIIKKIEPDVKVISAEETVKEKINENGDEEDDDNEKEVIRLVISGAFFAVGLAFNLPNWMELTVFLISYIISGGKIVLRALKNITRGQVFDENFLMSIATIGAFFIGEYPEGVAVMLFFQVGELFQELAVNRFRKSISALMDIRPDFANLKVGDDIKKVSPEEVSIGDVILVKPGEKIPLDGNIVEGSSMVDTSALTGESVPREVEAGNDVLSGFINKNGVLTIEVTKEFGESTVAKILALVQNASSRKACLRR